MDRDEDLQVIGQSIQDWMQASPSLKAEQQDEALRVLTALSERGLLELAALTNGRGLDLLQCLQESVPSPAALRFVAALHTQGQLLNGPHPRITMCHSTMVVNPRGMRLRHMS